MKKRRAGHASMREVKECDKNKKEMKNYIIEF